MLILERKGGREENGEREKETLIVGCLPNAPQSGINAELNLQTFSVWDKAPINSTARAGDAVFSEAAQIL